VALGIYISVPFCRTKCTYCNFASGVFSRAVFAKYVEKACADIAWAEDIAKEVGGEFDRFVDSVYVGGGTPSILSREDLIRIFKALDASFKVSPEAEITVECAPGTVTPELIQTLCRCGVNRVSLGVQSFVDEEARSVGRLHTRDIALGDIARLRASGITNINLDLIAGLPHQTAESWAYSLRETVATGVPHVSVYMLEIDDESRLGRELIAGGTKYHAHFVPDEDLAADLYVEAGRCLNSAGIHQYEISNFARTAFQSRHNLKYWTRQPYIGFGVDAHSMLPAGPDLDVEAVRFSTADSLEDFIGGESLMITPVSQRAALEEEFFLGLRLNRGVDLRSIGDRYRIPPTMNSAIADLTSWGLLQRDGDIVRLTDRGRLLSNEVFERFVLTTPEEVSCQPSVVSPQLSSSSRKR
jgi:oxygen-independent coproporphyrinogen-3 oxidase